MAVYQTGIVIKGDASSAVKAIQELSTAADGTTRNLTQLSKYEKQYFQAISGGDASAAAKSIDDVRASLKAQATAWQTVYGKTEAATKIVKSYQSAVNKLMQGGASSKDVLALSDDFEKMGISIDSSKKSFQEAEKPTEAFGSKIFSVAKNILYFQLVMGPIKSALQFVSQSLAESTKLAAAAEETWNLFSITFKDVADSAETAASRMSSALGTSLSTMQEGLSQTGNFFIGLGMNASQALETSEDFTQRIMDVISLKNVQGTTSDIMSAALSGVAGNTENFRKMGYVIKESSVALELAKNGQDKLTGSSLELAKALARVKIFMEQSESASGDLQRTMDSTENVTRRLKEQWKELLENVGSGINDWATPIKSQLEQIIERWNRMAKAAKEAKGKGSTSLSATDLNQQAVMTAIANTQTDKMSMPLGGRISAAATMTAGGALIGSMAGPLGTVIGGAGGLIASFAPDIALNVVNGLIKSGALPSSKQLDEDQTFQLLGQLTESLGSLNKAVSQAEGYGVILSEKGIASYKAFAESAEAKNIEERKASLGSSYYDMIGSNLKMENGLYAGDLTVSDFFSSLDRFKTAEERAGLVGYTQEDLEGRAYDAALKFWSDINNFQVLNADVGAGQWGQAFKDQLAGIIGQLKPVKDVEVKQTEAEMALASLISSLEGTRQGAQISESLAVAGIDPNSALGKKRQLEMQAYYTMTAAGATGLAMDEQGNVTGLDSGIATIIDYLYKIYLASDERAKAEKVISDIAKASEANTKALQTTLDAQEKAYGDMAGFTVEKEGLYAGKYASADEWKAGKFEELAKLEKAMEEAGLDATAMVAKNAAAIKEEYEARRQLIDENLKSEQEQYLAGLKKSLNPLAAYGEAYSSAGGGKEGVTAILLMMLGEMESIQAAAGIVSDILGYADKALQPLVPIIEKLAAELAGPLFSIMKTVALAVNFILMAVREIWAFLSFKWDDMAGIWDDYAETNKAILAATLDTNAILSEEDQGYIKAINDLVSKGLLSSAEGEALIQANAYDNSGYGYSTYGQAYSAMQGVSTVYYGGITIQITGVTGDEVARKVEQALIDMQGDGQNATGGK